jgi:hypothetical protein
LCLEKEFKDEIGIGDEDEEVSRASPQPLSIYI